MTVAIEAHNLGKRYRIGTRRPDRIGDAFRQALRGPVDRARAVLRGEAAGPATEDFWAVRGVDLRIDRGEAVALIGRNGQGKSTLLKMLSRVTTATEGSAVLHGRVGTLLEVGTGFHPELTGRENIWLNGALLGMSRREVANRFDEIVAFSEIEDFLETPVKRYSSGMYVRLGFAVAAHLEPEILLVDEVLAVGDAAFQIKCQNRIREIAEQDRTVVFVSHSMAAVKRLCPRTIWLDGGQVVADGPTDEVVGRYLDTTLGRPGDWDLRDAIADLPTGDALTVLDAGVRQDGRPVGQAQRDRPLEAYLAFQTDRPLLGLRVAIELLDDYGTVVARSAHDDTAVVPSEVPPGAWRATVALPSHLLAPRQHHLRFRAYVHNDRTLVGEGITIPIRVGSDTGRSPAYPNSPVIAVLEPDWPWTLEELP